MRTTSISSLLQVLFMLSSLFSSAAFRHILLSNNRRSLFRITSSIHPSHSTLWFTSSTMRNIATISSSPTNTEINHIETISPPAIIPVPTASTLTPTPTPTLTTINTDRVSLATSLKNYRTKVAMTKSIKPYQVLSNKALDGVIAMLPSTLEELILVSGIGPKISTNYGEDIIDIVNDHRGSDDVTDSLNTPSSSPSSLSSPPPSSSFSSSTIITPRILGDEITSSTLTSEQLAAASHVLEPPTSGHPNNLFITGSAGTGKSHLLKYVIQQLKVKHGAKGVGVVAPTGVAAVNVEGQTLHSFFGIGIASGLGNKGVEATILRKVRKSATTIARLNSCKVLVIDEISMVDSHLFTLLDTVARRCRNDGIDFDKPFGGMQVVCVGDFFQLPPVGVGKRLGNNGWQSDGDGDAEKGFCFTSDSWKELGLRKSENQITLNQVMRQVSGPFVDLLNSVRLGTVTHTAIESLNDKCLISFSHPLPNDGIEPTRLYCTNRDVDRENLTRLNSLPGDLITAVARDVWKEKLPSGSSAVKKIMVGLMDKTVPVEIQLKVGAQVLLTRNGAGTKPTLPGQTSSLVNGSRGVIVKIVQTSEGDCVPFVRFDNGIQCAIPYVETLKSSPDTNEGILSRWQVPLKLAWALTIHKSQGCTLSRAVLEIGDAFDYGQGYVALSRVKNVEGLWLKKRIRKASFMVSEEVKEFYDDVEGRRNGISLSSSAGASFENEEEKNLGCYGDQDGDGGDPRDNIYQSQFDDLEFVSKRGEYSNIDGYNKNNNDNNNDDSYDNDYSNDFNSAHEHDQTLTKEVENYANEIQRMIDNDVEEYSGR